MTANGMSYEEIVAHPAYFLHGWAFAWVFLLAGLPASIAAHAGVCFGVLALATFAGFAGVQ